MVSASEPIVIVGGGIVGLATALALRGSTPAPEVTVLEKESEVGRHQTGHNSGVIHSGIYYKPGSLKARLCVEGRRRLIAFCADRRIPYELPGKVIVATRPRELPILDEIRRRGQANGIEGIRVLDPEALRALEPHATGIRALHVPTTGIVEYAAVARAFALELVSHGGRIETGAQVLGLRVAASGVTVETTKGPVPASFLVNCAGLQSDTVAQMSGIRPPAQIVPFRGEYFLLRPERRSLVTNLIYPVPNPEMPFLGVHFTRTIHAEIEVGPNAVLALAREGYRRGQLDWGDLTQTLTYPGFPRMVRKFAGTAVVEYFRSLSPSAFTRDLRRLVPELRQDDLIPGGSGVRAQALGPDGRLLDDFVLAESPRAVHVLNAPSPAATASMAIGEHLCGLVRARRAGGS